MCKFKKYIIGTVGNPNDIQVLLDKLSANLGYRSTSQEDSLLFKVFVNRTVTELTLKVPSDTLVDSEEAEETIVVQEQGIGGV